MAEQSNGNHVADQYDVIVVGAGVAGAALAFELGRKGKKVLCVERSLAEPDRIVGELMQPGGILRLRKIGLESCVEGIDGISCEGYAVIINGERQQLSYPLNKGEKVLGKSFHHGGFIQNLRKMAASSSNVSLIQATAKRILEVDNAVIGIEYKDTTNDITKVAHAPLTVVCDGCFSDLRKELGQKKPVGSDHFVALILENCHLPFPNHGHVMLADPAPVLAYQIGSNEIRVLVDVPDPLPSSSNGDLQEFLLKITAPQMPLEIRDSFIASINGGKIKSMRNVKLHPNERCIRPGAILIGDAWNMRHPLTGGGMTVALSDVCIISDIITDPNVDIKDQSKVSRLFNQKFMPERKGLASTINILSFALYEVFCSPYDPTGKKPSMRSACFGYFKLGGDCVAGPMSLLSGLQPNPLVLLYHFFLVALYGVYITLKPFPTPAKILHAYRLLSAASWIVIPLMKGEKVFGLFTTMLRIFFYNFQNEKKLLTL